MTEESKKISKWSMTSQREEQREDERWILFHDILQQIRGRWQIPLVRDL
jgi:hypothetical protein